MRGLAALAGSALWAAAAVWAQTIEFESGGLRYQAQTRGGLTVMVAPLPTRILGYSIVQTAVTNTGAEPQVIAPEQFRFERATGRPIQALSARAVVTDVLNRAGRSDVGRLVGVYEAALFGNMNLELRHGYEARRKDAMAIGGARMRAAAAAAAIVLGAVTLEPGQSTDGAVFFPSANRPLGPGKLVVEAAGETFEFRFAPDPAPSR
jgi:hypothetical protein